MPRAAKPASAGGSRREVRRRDRRAARAAQEQARRTSKQHRLPPDSTTKHTLALPGRTLSFTATAGSIRLFDDKGEPQADVAYTSYQLDGSRPRDAAGDVPVQWRAGRVVGLAAIRRCRPVAAVDHGRGRGGLRFARPAAERRDLARLHRSRLHRSRRHRLQPLCRHGDDVRRRFWSVDGDVEAIALVIRRWLEKYDRLLSPKYVAGESYGGIRGPKIVHNLQTKQGVGVRGLILVSPVLDFRDWSGSSLLQYVGRLPTMAAVAREAKGPVTHKDLADVERYARGEFLLDLVKGQADTEATNRIADKVARLTGIDAAVTRRLAGRLTSANSAGSSTARTARSPDVTTRRSWASIPIRIQTTASSAIPPATR